MDLNVTAHEKDVSAAKTLSQSGTDPDIKSFALNALPILSIHLEWAKSINGKVNPAAFLTYAYLDGLAEVQLSQLAQQKASNTEVKDFAQRMIDDHTQANKEISQLAKQKGATLPSDVSPTQKATLTEFSKFSGKDFDKLYMDHNVVVHTIDVVNFTQQAAVGKDAEVKAFAAKTLLTLKDHLTLAKNINDKLQASFLLSAYQDGTAEVQLSHLALLKASNADVKAFAQKMIDDHTKANSETTQLAQRQGVTLTTEMPPKLKLAFLVHMKLSDRDFDKAFMATNIALHEKDVREFKEQSQSATNADTRSFAANTLPTLMAHLEEARFIANKLIFSQ